MKVTEQIKDKEYPHSILVYGEDSPRIELLGPGT